MLGNCLKATQPVLGGNAIQVRKNGVIIVNKTPAGKNGFYVLNGANVNFCPLPLKGHFKESVATQFYYLNVELSDGMKFQTLYKVGNGHLRMDDPDDKATPFKMPAAEKAKISVQLTDSPKFRRIQT